MLGTALDGDVSHAYVPAGTGSVKNLWNKKAVEDDKKFLTEQEKIETPETQINQ